MNLIYQKIFLYGLNLSYFLYFIVLLGVGGFAPEYLVYLRNFLKYYVAILLIVIYNPITYDRASFNEIDRKSTITFVINNYLREYEEKYKVKPEYVFKNLFEMSSQLLIKNGI